MTMFRIKLIGCLDNSSSAVAELQEKIAKEFGLSIETVNALFQRLPCVFKDNLNKSEADHYSEILNSLGAQITIESIAAKANEEESFSLSLVSTDTETGTIENLEIASEKSVPTPEDNWSFEFGDSDSDSSQPTSSPSSAATASGPTVIKPLSIAEELSGLSLSDLDFEPSQKEVAPEPTPEEEQPLEDQERIETETVIEEQTTPRDPYSTDLSVGKYQTEPFNEITDPLKPQSTEQAPTNDSNRAFGKTLDAAFAASPGLVTQTNQDSPDKVSKLKPRYIAFALVAIVLAALPLIFLSTRNSSNSGTTMFSQFESLLSQQKDIINGVEQQGENLETLPPEAHWLAQLQREEFNIDASLTMRGTRLQSISLILQQKEPPKLTPKQIVDKVAEPLWLDRFELSEDLSKKLPEANSVELRGRAYIRQRNGLIPTRRVIATAVISVSKDQSTPNLQLTWEIKYGDPQADIINKAVFGESQLLSARYTDTITLSAKN